MTQGLISFHLVSVSSLHHGFSRCRNEQGIRSGRLPWTGPREALPAHIVFQTRSSVLELQLSFRDGPEATTLLCSYVEAHTSLRTS